MTNELQTLEESSFGIEIKPAELSMTNYDDMKKVVEEFADKYKGMVFTAEEKSGATAARSELLSIQKAIDSERKRVKKIYNKPLEEFEAQLNALVDRIGEPLNDIRDGLKVIDEGEREQRESRLNTYIKGVAETEGVSVDDIERDPKWLNKGMFTNALKPNSKLKDAVNSEVERVRKEKERYEENKTILTRFCESKGIEPSGWIAQLEYRSPTEIMDVIHDQEKEEKENLEELSEPIKEEKSKAEEKSVEELFEPETSERKSKDFVVIATDEQFEKLFEFCEEHDISISSLDMDDFSDLPF